LIYIQGSIINPDQIKIPMLKVTYLIGAGASANALPIVKSNPEFNIEGLPTALRRVGNQIKKENQRPIFRNKANDLKEGFDWLAENSELYNTVDTFAKYCNLQKKGDLGRLKKLLSIYFTIDQIINKKFDNRYLVFLTTILENNYKFPDAIKILNWNYDMQFQTAANIFKKEGLEIKDSNSYLQLPPLINYYPSLGMYPSYVASEMKDYSLVHLNGIAGYIHNDQDFVLTTASEGFTIDDFLESSAGAIEVNKNLLSFAWEDSKHKKISESQLIADNIIKESEILVIIGYSFPFFNREIDKKILKTLIDSGLKKIYYQDKFRNGDFLYSQYDLKGKVDIESIDKVDQLFIPTEL
jgi:hypothetical protein